MFIIDLIGKLLEVFLSESYREALARRHGTRRFARELLEIYEQIGVYIRDCRQFAEAMDRERELVPSGRLTPGTVRDLRGLADRMATVLRSLIARFGSEFHRMYIDEESRDNHSRRARTIVEIMDPDLASIMDSVYNDELGLMLSVEFVTCRLVDQSHMTIPPDLIQSLKRTRGYLGVPVQHNEAGDRKPSDEVVLVMTLDLRDDAQFQTLRQTLMRSIEGAAKLREAISAHLRTRYTVEDLL